MSKIFIHQPDFCPWLNFFLRANAANYYVVLDDVQFNRRGWLNKDIIKSNKGPLKITIPVKKSDRVSTFVKDIKISYDQNWTDKILRTLKMNYSKSPLFKKNIQIIEEIFDEKFEFMMDLNLKFIKYFFNILNIKTKIIKSSELKITSNGSDKILDICKELSCDEYITGDGSKNYLNSDKFLTENILTNYSMKFNKIYDQVNGKFIENLSIIDYFLNCYNKNKKNNILK